MVTDLFRNLFLDAAVLQIYDPFQFVGIKRLADVSPAAMFV